MRTVHVWHTNPPTNVCPLPSTHSPTYTHACAQALRQVEAIKQRQQKKADNAAAAAAAQKPASTSIMPVTKSRSSRGRQVKQSVKIGSPKEAQNYWKQRPEAGAKEAAAQGKAAASGNPFSYPAPKKARTQQQQQQAALAAEEADVEMTAAEQEAALEAVEAALQGVEADAVESEASGDEDWEDSEDESEQ